MRTEINNWINRGTNYQEGVSLYEQYGTNSYLKTIFKRNDGTYNRAKLIEELCELRDQSPLPLEAAPVSQPTTHNLQPEASQPEPIQLTTPNPQPDAPALLKLKKDINDTWSQLRGLHPYLSIYPEGEQLRQLEIEIVKLARKNTELYTKLDYYHEHGVLPVIDQPVSKPPLMIDINLLNKRELIRKSLSKAVNRVRKQAKPKPHTLKLIQQKRLELAEIDQVIAQIKSGANG